MGLCRGDEDKAVCIHGNAGGVNDGDFPALSKVGQRLRGSIQGEAEKTVVSRVGNEETAASLINGDTLTERRERGD